MPSDRFEMKPGFVRLYQIEKPAALKKVGAFVYGHDVENFLGESRVISGNQIKSRQRNGEVPGVWKLKVSKAVVQCI